MHILGTVLSREPTELRESIILAFISVRLPCYVVGLVAVNVWRYDAVSTSRDPSGRSRRFLPSAVQGYAAAQAGWATDRKGMRREISPRVVVVSLGYSGWAFVFELDGRRKGKMLKRGERSGNQGASQGSRRGADVLRPGSLLVYRFIICPAVEAPRRP